MIFAIGIGRQLTNEIYPFVMETYRPILNWTPILSLIDDWTIKSAIEPIVLYKVGTSVSYDDVSYHDVSFMNS